MCAVSAKALLTGTLGPINISAFARCTLCRRKGRAADVNTNAVESATYMGFQVWFCIAGCWS